MENQIILYNNNEGKVSIKVTYLNDTFWLPQKAISALFGVETPAISKHLANIYETGELLKEATISILETVQFEGSREVKRRVEFYNLDAIIAVGYREEYEHFRIQQDKTYLSDLDKEIKKLKKEQHKKYYKLQPCIC